MHPPFQAIVFDFDYTLADSSRGVIDCINYALGGLGLPAVSAGRACRTIGLSLPDTFHTLTGQTDAGQTDVFVHRFVERSDQVMVDRTVLFAETRPVIEALASQGLALAIVSTKFRRRIEAVLAREDLLDPFAVIIGGEDVAEHKPDPRGLLSAITRMGHRLEGTLYVGDSVVDAETAQRAGVPFVPVLSGMTPQEAFEPYPRYRILDRLSDLPGLLWAAETTGGVGT